jgi:hypothetical protein
MSVDALKGLTEVGISLQLEGDNLMAFVDKEMEKLRGHELKMAERETQRLEMQRAHDAERMHEETKRLEMTQEREARNAERELKKLEMEHEKWRGEFERTSKPVSTATPVGADGSSFKVKLPFFDNHRDGIDSYIKRFERFAVIEKWSENDKATRLGALNR